MKYQMPNNPEEDRLLAKLCTQGDMLAFDRLITKYQEPIITLCTHFLGNKHDGEDAAQDTFMKVYTHIDSFRGTARFSTWLYRVALNTCKNKQQSWWSRFWKNAVHVDKPITTPDSEDTAYQIADNSLSPSTYLDRKQTQELVHRGLCSIPHHFREIIILYDIQGFSYEEIHDITGMMLGTIKSRLARARAALMQTLKGSYHEATRN